MEIHKNGEAKLTRRVAFYGLLILVIWGFREFSKWVARWPFGRKVLFDGFELPYYQQQLTVGVLMAIVLTSPCVSGKVSHG